MLHLRALLLLGAKFKTHGGVDTYKAFTNVALKTQVLLLDKLAVCHGAEQPQR